MTLVERRAALHAILRLDLSAFVCWSFTLLNPRQTLTFGPHIDAVCFALQQVVEGKAAPRLSVNMPPRTLKSHIASVCLVAWVLGRWPEKRVICVSYSDDLARKFARDCRALMETPAYKALFPRTRLNRKKSSETEFETTQRGSRFATSIGGTLTGRGGDLIIIDDPIKAEEAYSEAARERASNWIEHTLLSRLDNQSKGKIIVVMQRLHVDDVAGRLADKGWPTLVIPLIAEEPQTLVTGLGKTVTRNAGDVLMPELFSQSVVERLRRDLGTHAFGAQYQQQPQSVEGNLLKMKWFPRYDERPDRSDYDRIVQSWDTASKSSELNDYSVCTTWLTRGDKAYLVNVFRARLDYPSLRHKVKELKSEWNADLVLIEDQGSGTSVLQDLGEKHCGLVGVRPKGDKVTRMSTVSARIEGGHVHLPKEAQWLAALERELQMFPHGDHDDQVDSMSQFLNWWRNDPFCFQAIEIISVPRVDRWPEWSHYGQL